MKYLPCIGLLCCVTLFPHKVSLGQCDRLMKLCEEALSERNYQLAIERLLDTRDVCPGQKEKVNALIKRTFELIEGEKTAAANASQQAAQSLEEAIQAQRGLEASVILNRANNLLEEDWDSELNRVRVLALIFAAWQKIPAQNPPPDLLRLLTEVIYTPTTETSQTMRGQHPYYWQEYTSVYSEAGESLTPLLHGAINTKFLVSPPVYGLSDLKVVQDNIWVGFMDGRTWPSVFDGRDAILAGIIDTLGVALKGMSRLSFFSSSQKPIEPVKPAYIQALPTDFQEDIGIIAVGRSPEGNRCYLGTRNREIIKVDPDDLSPSSNPLDDLSEGKSAPGWEVLTQVEAGITHLVGLPNVQGVICATRGGKIIHFDVSGKMKWEVEVNSSIKQMKLDPQQTRLWVLTENASLQVLTLSDGSFSSTPPDIHDALVFDFEFSFDGQQLLVGKDQGISLIDYEADTLLLEIPQEETIYRVMFIPGKEYFATGGNLGTVQLWNSQGGNVGLYKGQGPIVEMDTDTGGNFIAAGTLKGYVYRWYLPEKLSNILEEIIQHKGDFLDNRSSLIGETADAEQELMESGEIIDIRATAFTQFIDTYFDENLKVRPFSFTTYEEEVDPIVPWNWTQLPISIPSPARENPYLSRVKEKHLAWEGIELPELTTRFYPQKTVLINHKNVGLDVLNYRNREDFILHPLFWEPTEVTNQAYSYFLQEVEENFSADAVMEPNVGLSKSDLYPDSTVWIRDFSYAYNEPLAENYFWHPAFKEYPVVGVSYEAAQLYCQWKSKIVTQEMNKKNNSAFTYQYTYRLPTLEEWHDLALNHSHFMLRINPVQEYNGIQLMKEQKKVNSNNSLRENTVQQEELTPQGEKILNTLRSIRWTEGDYKGLDGYFYTAPSDPPFRDDLNEMYHLMGNVSEMVYEKGIAKGGNWSLLPEETDKATQDVLYYHRPTSWLGFRCVCEVEIVPKKP